MDERQFCSIVGIQPGTAQTWRMQGKGPRYVKIGRLVRYHVEDVLAWIERNSIGAAQV